MRTPFQRNMNGASLISPVARLSGLQHILDLGPKLASTSPCWSNPVYNMVGRNAIGPIPARNCLNLAEPNTANACLAEPNPKRVEPGLAKVEPGLDWAGPRPNLAEPEIGR